MDEPGHLTNGAFRLAEPLRVEFSTSAWTAPTSNELVRIWISSGRPSAVATQLVKGTDPLRTGSYSRTLTFTLATTVRSGRPDRLAESGASA